MEGKLKKSVLAINVYFAPNSFGGATIVAENMAQLLEEYHDWNVTVLTTVMEPSLSPYAILRFKSKGANIIAINLPGHLTYTQQYKHHQFAELVSELAEQICPDVAHIHSVQNMGASIIDALHELDIPTVVTVHDCWWICERQFMIKANGLYCHQTKIDFDVCSRCVADPQASAKRFQYLTDVLSKADKMLFPSAFQRDLFIANGFDENICHVNKNGVLMPNGNYSKTPIKADKHKVRFGFAGGPGAIKGLDLIIEAFQKIKRSDYELVLVDGAMNAKSTWAQGFKFDIPGQLTVLPAFSQQTMDDFYGEIDVLLFPSQWKESFGLTVRESLVRDVWVIATNGGGSVEDCEDGVNSKVIPLTADSNYLKEAIEDCLEKDWSTFVNVRKNEIQSIEAQAAELSGYLLEAIGR